MNLQQLIERLQKEPSDRLASPGFGPADSYRCYYEQIAFEPKPQATAGQMLEEALKAIDSTYCGYKGGTYKMGLKTLTNIAEYGVCPLDDEGVLSEERLDSMFAYGDYLSGQPVPEGTPYDDMLDVEIRLDRTMAEAVSQMAAQGYLGSTPEAVIEHCLREFLFERMVRVSNKSDLKP